MDKDSEFREALADIEHKQWNSACAYILASIQRELLGIDISTSHVNIELFDCVKRWRRQAKTPYPELTEKEKDSDRVWADKVLDLLKGEREKQIDSALDEIGSLFGSIGKRIQNRLRG